MCEETQTRRSGILIITHGSSDLAADLAFSDLLFAELKEKYPEALVCQAYSAPKTLQRIDRERAQTPVNTVPEMLEYMEDDGVTDLYVLAANLNPCKKYFRVVGMIEPCRSSFTSVRISPPLLNSEDDPVEIAGVLGGILEEAVNPGTDLIVLAAHTANEEITELWQPVLDQMQRECAVPIRLIFHNGKPGFSDLLSDLCAAGTSQNIVVIPMMLFGGRHLQKDLMAEEGSLSAMLKEFGHNVTVSPKGLGEYPAIRELFYKKNS